MNIGNKFAKKSLGQNFIFDDNFLLKMNSFVDTSKDNVIIEIGPGKGALTKYLAEKKFKKLYLIEKDNKLAADLDIKYEGNKKIIIFHDDALVHKYDYLKNERNKVIIYGNLPFNVSTKLLTLWISVDIWPSFFEKMILMFQKEVADRILAKHNNKLYGRLSVLVQSRCKVKKLLDAPSSIFRPQPRVDGTVLQFEPIKKYNDVDFSTLAELLEKSFNSRRKKIKNTLKEYHKLLQKLKIDENSRPENLSVADYCNLVKLINFVRY